MSSKLFDPAFEYTPSFNTDIRKTFERVRLEMMRARTPYPVHCLHPEKCCGRSSCPRDPICID